MAVLLLRHCNSSTASDAVNGRQCHRQGCPYIDVAPIRSTHLQLCLGSR
jgi:hypothetical protein